MKIEKIYILLLAIVFGGCSSADRTSDIVHPTPQNMAAGSTITQQDRTDVAASPLQHNFTQKATIGVDYGDESEMFGFIEDVSIDAAGRFYVLDSDQQTISRFDAEGNFLTTVAHAGQGPGELEYARSMALYDDEWLLVGNGYRVERFHVAADSVRFVETKTLDKEIINLCVMNNQLFVHHAPSFEDAEKALEQGTSLPVIQSYRLPDIDAQFGFGASYSSDNAIVVGRMSTGAVSCNAESAMVLFSFEKTPIVEGYNGLNGKRKWRSRINDLYLPTVIQEKVDGRTRLTYRTPENGISDVIMPTQTLAADHELLQVQRRIADTENYEMKTEVLTYHLDARNGDGFFLGKKVPLIIAMRKATAAALNTASTYTELSILAVEKPLK